jgi:hypothetical protein
MSTMNAQSIVSMSSPVATNLSLVSTPHLVGMMIQGSLKDAHKTGQSQTGKVDVFTPRKNKRASCVMAGLLQSQNKHTDGKTFDSLKTFDEIKNIEQQEDQLAAQETTSNQMEAARVPQQSSQITPARQRELYALTETLGSIQQTPQKKTASNSSKACMIM